MLTRVEAGSRPLKRPHARISLTLMDAPEVKGHVHAGNVHAPHFPPQFNHTANLKCAEIR